MVAGGLSVSMIADVDLLIALYGEDGPFSAWRILSVDDCGSAPVTATVPRLLPAASVMEHMPLVRSLAIDNDNRLVSFDGQPWHHGGWQYSAVGSFITDIAYGLEMTYPGFAKRAIPEYRDLLRKALPVAPDTTLAVTRAPEGVDKWRISAADEVARGLGIVGLDDPAPGKFSFHFRDVLGELNSLLLYKLNGFDQSQVVWDVPDTQTSVGRSTKVVLCDSQLSLALF